MINFNNLTKDLLAKKKKIEVFETGIIELDYLLDGGIPKGRLIEVHGDEDSGKTLLLLHMIKENQLKDNISLYIGGQELSTAYLNVLGINPEMIYIANPLYVEEIAPITDELLKTGAINLAVIDGFNAVPTKQEKESFLFEDSNRFEKIFKMINNLTLTASRYNVPIIITNRITTDVKSMELRPAYNYYFNKYASLRIKTNLKEHFTHDKLQGRTMEIEITKNKLGKDGTIEADVLYNGGISKNKMSLET